MLFTPQDEEYIIEAIRQAEAMSTGEIRVHLDQNLKGDALATAQSIFTKLGMEKTKDRNGVLFYVSENKKKIAIIGDINIHKYVYQNFWDELLKEITLSFKDEKYKEGLINAILKTGTKLKKFFPTDGKNIENELSNEISR
ncbi:TLP18.3, Psb32 and MOLO-1 founding protein of phosphatase [Apibacter mensalis]|uniref:TLP18.3, Psb32 and MOLO-1 founding protein of phosphatase n=1 Tax=Apibacter mensalis TaxID=1586267 RepID=A0A0X3AR80_9FLAO|nr:TPM domain-containing protein [Apibacter mensalis]CVK16844.1 TLP18.3, Psb32 and MOLO-1 founding protein of phosphatase [Apibacter mensalis]